VEIDSPDYASGDRHHHGPWRSAEAAQAWADKFNAAIDRKWDTDEHGFDVPRAGIIHLDAPRLREALADHLPADG
jgi:hypothetical protein